MIPTKVAETAPKISISPDIKHLLLDENVVSKFNEIFVIGDVHGCADELEKLLGEIHSSSDVKDSHSILKIFVGDLVNKGPANERVIELVHRLWGKSSLAVRGNHDEHVLNIHYGINKNKSEKNNWMKRLSSDDIEFLRKLPYTISLPSLNCIIVHAGLLPIASDPIGNTPPSMMVRMRNVVINDSGDKIVGTISDKEGQGGWASFWKGPQHIYFGHDAKRRLQLHPFATGLDTGCVYGDRLTGIFIKGPRKGKMVFVKAARVYEPVLD